MKTLGILAAVAVATAGVPRADAMFVGDLFNKAKNSLVSFVEKTAGKVKNVVTGLGDKASHFAKNALQAAANVGKHLLNKMEDATKALTGKAKDWLFSKAQEIAHKLPGVFGKWAEKGITWGMKASDALEKKLHELIHKGVNWGSGLLDKGVKLGTEQLNTLKGMLTARVTQGVALVRDVARGKVNYVVGMMQNAMKPAGMKISEFLNKQLKVVKSKVPADLPGPLPVPPKPSM
jgi:hypothetical protein